jgi:hypothetical protein
VSPGVQLNNLKEHAIPSKLIPMPRLLGRGTTNHENKARLTLDPIFGLNQTNIPKEVLNEKIKDDTQ